MKRENGSPQSPETSQPDLTSRMRLLVSRIQHEIIDPARGDLERANELLREARFQIEYKREEKTEAIAKARTALQDNAKDMLATATRDPRGKLSEIDRLVATARKHLEAQGIVTADTNHITATAVSSSGIQTNGRATRSEAGSASLAAECLEWSRQLVNEEICKTHKPTPAFWPKSNGVGCSFLAAGCAIAAIIGGCRTTPGGSITVNILYFFAVFAIFAGAMWVRYHMPIARLKKAARELRLCELKAKPLLNRLLQEASANAKAEIDSKEKNLRDQEEDLRNTLKRLADADESQFKVQTAKIEQRLRSKIPEFQEAVDSFWTSAGFSGADWDDAEWENWSPSVAPSLAVRFGVLAAETDDLKSEFPSLDLDFELPALVPFSDDRCLLFDPDAANKNDVNEAVQGSLARLLANIPSGKARFTFIDPVGLGSNVAGFMPLADHEESMVTSRAWTEPQHIEQRLADVTEHMETVIQKYLRNEFKTIQEYNVAAGEVAEPYRFVVVFDFPVNFSETAARRLVSIARNGPRCGVFAIIVHDRGKPMPYGFKLTDLANACAVVGTSNKKDRRFHHDENSKASQNSDSVNLRWLETDLEQWLLLLDWPPPQPRLTKIIEEIGGRAREAMRVEVPYHKLLTLAELGPDTWWKATTTKAIRLPLGPTGARKLQYLTLGEGMSHHVLIVGRPGSGKSNLMHVIITSLALTYSPDEMRVYLIDFKKGVEFKSYADHKLPHADAIAVESEREFGLSVVERLDAELKSRGDLFRAAGAASVTEYREKTKIQIPRILLIVDEFQEFFTQDDHVARQTTLILDRLVRQGRAFGIHIMLGSQTLAGSYNLPKSTLDQMAVRIAMQCSEADSRLVLADDNPAARLLSRPGEAIYNAASGLVEGNNLFQVARFNDEDREERLRLITDIAQRSNKPVPVPIVFEGNELAPLEDCRSLSALLSAPDWAGKKTVQLLLGEPIAIRDPIAVRIRRQSGNHLLILSRDEAEGVGMCIASVVSILAQQSPNMAKIFIADFTLADSEWAERAEEIEEFFPHEVKVLSKQRSVAEAVKEIYSEVKRRVDAPPDPSSIFLVLQGLQRMKVLRTDEDSFRYDDGTTPSELLAYILREGPETGVHVIAWCDTYPNAARLADRRTMNEFGTRAGGVMSADDSMNFFDDAAASRIDKPHRLLFFDEERPGQLDKFRPYSMPPREWLKSTGNQMASRVKK